MRFSNRLRFLLLRSSREDPSSRQLLFLKDQRQLISHWHSGDRVAPIVPAQHTSLTSLPDREVADVYFFGPLYPGKVPAWPNLFLTHGLFNLVVIDPGRSDSETIRDFLNRESVPWECWALEGTTLVNVLSDQRAKNLTQDRAPKVLKLAPNTPELRHTLQEYDWLLKSVWHQADQFHARLREDLDTFHRLLGELLSDPRLKSNQVARHGLLTVANSALARHLAQTYNGRSPILDGSFYYQRHSLLGIGVVSLALYKVRRFVQEAISAYPVASAVKSLEKHPAASKPLYDVDSTDPFWKGFELHGSTFSSASSPSRQGGAAERDKPLPLLTCISSRDGFRATQLTLSAPRDIIAACNTPPWTLLTITHEISHCIIGGVLGALLPNPDDEEEDSAFIDLVDLLAGDRQPSHLLDQLREWIAFALIRLEYSEEDIRDITISVELLRKIVRSKWLEANEVLTHVFDFLYFYRKDKDRYIDSLWASWAVIPNIHNRVRDYVLRSAAALHSMNLDVTSGNIYELTAGQLAVLLERARSRFPDALYIPEALAFIEEQPDEVHEGIQRMENLVRLVRHVLYSEDLAKEISKERVQHGSRAARGYALSRGEFPPYSIENPLRFLEAFATGQELNEKHSLWMLQQLAFAGEEETRVTADNEVS